MKNIFQVKMQRFRKNLHLCIEFKKYKLFIKIEIVWLKY
jgi:hypothetical protein